MEKINAIGRRVLLISDLHIPYHHPDSFKFLAAIKEKFLDKKSIAINLGDSLDGHALSFHPTDSDLFSAGDELKKAIEVIHCKGGLFETFPDMIEVDSNHSSLIYRRAKFHGIPLDYVKSLPEVLETPSWRWVDDILLDTKLGNIYICHGKSGAYNKLAQNVGCSACQGHFHGKFEITWAKSITTERFNMFCGSLISEASLAFAYGKNHLPKPILGVGLISESGYPRLIKMNINSKGRWDGKLP